MKLSEASLTLPLKSLECHVDLTRFDVDLTKITRFFLQQIEYKKTGKNSSSWMNSKQKKKWKQLPLQTVPCMNKSLHVAMLLHAPHSTVHTSVMWLESITCFSYTILGLWYPAASCIPWNAIQTSPFPESSQKLFQFPPQLVTTSKTANRRSQARNLVLADIPFRALRCEMDSFLVPGPRVHGEHECKQMYFVRRLCNFNVGNFRGKAWNFPMNMI